jgi:hypothetical protein
MQQLGRKNKQLPFNVQFEIFEDSTTSQTPPPPNHYPNMTDCMAIPAQPLRQALSPLPVPPIFKPGTYENVNISEITSMQTENSALNHSRNFGSGNKMYEEILLPAQWKQLAKELRSQLIKHMACKVCLEPPGRNYCHKMSAEVKGLLDTLFQEVGEWNRENLLRDPKEWVESVTPKLQMIEWRYWKANYSKGCILSEAGGMVNT